ncbi:MAG: enoyl-CoA hydratase/isomerase family protein [Nitriliruptoraceae bacterium]|nr:enoyl-CoA hydratase/isomerase family protein [Nitriliruptoraceae bacterium]
MTGPVRTEHVDTPNGAIVVVTLHRPEVRNALDTGLLAALVDTLDDLPPPGEVRGLVLTGAGGAFSAGADIHEATTDGGRRRMELFTTVHEQLLDLRLPTVAAIEGVAIGGGAELAGGCDVRIAARDAVLRFPGAIYGVPVGVARTVGQVGLSVAKDWVLSSRDVPAEEAERRGFVQQLVEPGAAREAAIGWATVVAGRDAATVALLGSVFDQQSGLRDRVMFENDALRSQAETGQLPDLGTDLPRTVRPRRH